MKRSLSEYLDLMFWQPAAGHPQAAWRPAADLFRCDCGWLAKFDLAGVRPEAIDVCVQGSKITVSGERRDCRVYEHQEAHLMEIAYSRFERSIELPEQIGQAEIRTEYRDGMLLVHVLTHAR